MCIELTFFSDLVTYKKLHPNISGTSPYFPLKDLSKQSNFSDSAVRNSVNMLHLWKKHRI